MAARIGVNLRALAMTVVCLGLVGLSAACVNDSDLSTGASSETPRDEAKTGDGTERHELDPLISRIPVLQSVVDATWFSGTIGSRDVPGPSLYWIDAVVTLPTGAADELRGTLELTVATDVPGVDAALEPALPGGEVLVGDELDDAFSHEGWRTTAYLSATGDGLVLVITGE